MKLLDALAAEVNSKRIGITDARLVYFAFSNFDESAFLSEIEIKELVPLMERWCVEQRAQMGLVH